MIKNYVIDTNVIIHDPYFFRNFEDNNVIIPIICIEELDKLKKREGMVGYQARESLRAINHLRESGNPLTDGITLDNGGTLRIEMNKLELDFLPNTMSKEVNDNKILAIARNIGVESDIPTVLVTKDLLLAIKADSLNVPVEDYKSDKQEIDTVYSGYSEIELDSESLNKIFEGGLELPEDFSDIPPNHFFHITDRENYEHEVVAKYDGDKIIPMTHINEKAWGIKPINMEQKMAFELLMDPEIHLVSITGGAGSGKTILSTSVALQKVLDQGYYRKIIFVRPIVSAGKDIGYLPGKEEEKLKPWMGPFYDTIDYMFQKKRKNPEITVDEFLEDLRRNGIIETKTFNYMRGRTLANAFVIIDEAQQTTPHLAKLMLTRAGNGSKFVFNGDLSDNQIDNIHVDSKSNGLAYILSKMKHHKLTGHIELKHVERSPLAKLAEKSL